MNFDTTFVEARKTVTISQSLNASSDINANIYVPFRPDEVIVKSVTLSNYDAAMQAGNFYCTLINDIMFATAAAAGTTVTHTPDLHYQTVGMIVNGPFRFSARTFAGAVQDNMPNCTISFQLEFVKYRGRVN